MRVLLMVMLGAVGASAAGCGDGGGLSRTEVESRVIREVGEREGGGARAACVERAEKRTWRCEVTIGSATYFYDVLVSKDSERVQLVQR